MMLKIMGVHECIQESSRRPSTKSLEKGRSRPERWSSHYLNIFVADYCAASSHIEQSSSVATRGSFKKGWEGGREI